MARRPNHLHPQPRLHKKSGHGRVRIAGEEYSLGLFGSREASAEYDRLIGEWLASGKSKPPSRRPRCVTAEPSKPCSATPESAAPTAVPRAKDAAEPVQVGPPATLTPAASANQTSHIPATLANNVDLNGITVGELCTRWMDYIERNRCHNGKDSTSLYYGARQVTVALKSFWSYPAAAFGSRCLLQVQEQLVHTPVISRPKDPNKPPKVRARNRTTVNDTVNRIRSLFRWGVLHELVPEDRVPILKIVPPLLPQQTSAPDSEGVKPVPDHIVEGTLPHLPQVAADLLRFERLAGCRPGEARRLRPCDIDTRDIPLYRGTWIWTPYRHKNKWRKKRIPRRIVIRPDAQAILKPWLDRVAGKPEAHIFSPRFSERRAAGGRRVATKDTPRVPVPSRHVNDFYSKDSLNKAIERACKRAGLPKWTANQIRHTRLTELRETVSLDAAQAIGGHTNVNTTERYAHIQLVAAIDAALSG
jgi:integrase